MKRPDWVMVGVEQPDGTVLIYASKNVQGATIELVREPHPDTDMLRPLAFVERPTHVELGARLTDAVAASGTDYGHALATLLQHWQPAPDEPEQPKELAP